MTIDKIIKFGLPIIDEQEKRELDSVLETGIFVHGPKTTGFEEQFAQLFNYKHAVSVSSCTAGLHMAHHCLSKAKFHSNRTSEVLCPAMTHVATAHAIELCGLKPVFVDCDLVSGNSTVSHFEEKMTKNTIGIATVHFNGVACDIENIASFAKNNNLYLIEDCAISLGAQYNGIPVGSFGNCGVFSFHPVKQMTTGEGGMVVVNENSFSDELKYSRAFGVDKNFQERNLPGQYEVPYLGFNYRMSELSASIGLSQLQKIESFQKKRRENYEVLEKLISTIPGISCLGSSKIKGRTFYTFIIIIEDEKIERDQIVLKMLSNGIQTSIYYPSPVPRFLYYKNKYGYKSIDFINAAKISDRSIALPIGPHLDVNDMKIIASYLKEALNGEYKN